MACSILAKNLVSVSHLLNSNLMTCCGQNLSLACKAMLIPVQVRVSLSFLNLEDCWSDSCVFHQLHEINGKMNFKTSHSKGLRPVSAASLQRYMLIPVQVRASLSFLKLNDSMMVRVVFTSCMRSMERWTSKLHTVKGLGLYQCLACKDMAFSRLF